MRIIISLFILCITFFTALNSLHAEVSDAEVVEKIKDCMAAKNPRSITEYTCAKGDFAKETGKALSDEDVAYFVIMSVRFKDLDKDALKIMEQMQSNRQTNGLSWIDYINTTVKPFWEKYNAVCTSLGGDLKTLWVWKEEKKEYPTTDGFPQTFCNDTAKKKAKAWENMGYILASKGIAKWYQNAKDTHLDTVKGKYEKLLEKWQWYERVIDTAVSKFTAYIRDPVK